ncbi:MAG: toll/interleukin-1 receptor domain-containing protein [Gammaproteobacteria bacterium]
MSYDAFISYSHANDRPIAKDLQNVIQTLGKPWYKVRSVRVFRDETSLTATPELWPSIVLALEQSRFLILIASPEAAQSPWVAKELEWWLANKRPETLLLALSEGTLEWDSVSGDFDREKSTALPSKLIGCFRSEPFWIDVSQRREATVVVRRDTSFHSLASKVAARLKGMPPEDLWSRELLQQRRNLQTAGVAILALLVLLGFSIRQTYLAMQNEAVAQIAQMNTAIELGDYTVAFQNAAAIKREYLLTKEQSLAAEASLYRALWANRLVKRSKLDEGQIVRFKEGSEEIYVQKIERNSPDVPSVDLLPRNWQKPNAFAQWSSDRKEIRIPLPDSVNDGQSGKRVHLQDCLAGGDDHYRIANRSSDSDNFDEHFTSTELLEDTTKAIEGRNHLVAPVYHFKNGGEIVSLIVEIASEATLQSDWNQEVLCVFTVSLLDGEVVAMHNPDLTLSASSRIDRMGGSRRIAPNGRYYVEMESQTLTLRSGWNFEKLTTIGNDLSFLTDYNNIDGLIAFSKSGSKYIFSGLLRKGKWEQPHIGIEGYGESSRTELTGHNNAVHTILISDSGKTAITIDTHSVVRVWNLSNEVTSNWLDKSETAIKPAWIEQNNYYDDKYNSFREQIEGIEALYLYGQGPFHATLPECGRALVYFGGNSGSPVIYERDAATYLGIVDLNEKSLIYAELVEEEYSKHSSFYFCSPVDTADYAIMLAKKLSSTENSQTP